MDVQYPDFEQLLVDWHLQTYQFAFLLTRRPKLAQEAVFQTFLYMGQQPKDKLRSPRECVFRWAWRTGEDNALRKGGHRLLKRGDMVQICAFPITDGLWTLLKTPLKNRAAYYLIHCLGMSPEECGRILKISTSRAEALAVPPKGVDPDELKQDVLAIRANPDWVSDLGDSLYIHFSERSVRVENALRRFRSGMDRIVPWLALLVILLCALAVWYVGTLPPVEIPY